MKTAVTIEARMTSTRLPGKVLKKVGGKPLLEYMIDRLQRMETIDDIIVATTTNDDDDPIVALAKKKGVKCYRGSEMDVLGRVLEAAQQFNVDTIVETTADCPIIDPFECDKVVKKFKQGGFDYVSNVITRTYPRGMDTQVFSTRVLKEVSQLTQHPADREHVAYYIYTHPERYKLANIESPVHLYDPDLRLTVDTPEDFIVIREIIESLYAMNKDFSLSDVMHYLNLEPWVRGINRHIQQKAVTRA